MLVAHLPLFFVLGIVSLSAAQSSTSTVSSSPSTTTTRSGTHTASGSASLAANVTTTLSANGTATATATIVNGTTLNGTTMTLTTPTSTSPAAFPTLGGISSCVIGCFQNSVSQANCTSITDEACFCSSETFRTATVGCVSTQCPSELAGAESLAQQFCNMVSVSITFPSPTASGSATASSAPTGSNGTQELTRSVFLAAMFGVTGISWLVFGW